MPEAFHARFPVAAYVVVASAFGRRGSAYGRFLPTLARKSPLVSRVVEAGIGQILRTC